MIPFVPKNEQKDLFELAKEKLGNVLIESSLYSKNIISNDSFSRQNFEKGGSKKKSPKTTLIGGGLKNKTIIRHIKPEHFLTWQKVYKNYKLWEKAGFDYVPIEPIQSFKLNKENLVNVYSGVLDLDLYDWKQITDEFVKELEEDREKIIEILEKNKIKHGHTNVVKNFCLRFFRDKNGNVDFNQKPRIYLIDWDQAVSY
ncbi:hypothetical protein CVV26_02925 [Candidatus Kuenenbacteria bacterium HGW-Kuenenbacteria-1]|uniref:Uncharacterized protein n=1 Tax=Candidatus Kuenenbacteria bacterium HGW-Kuenenbacteria-1 TaxID=2013812 RepID=A0A2N1UN21_9BACT|nr:MAG: hypothetical protein CVV26_02925 [Candidatus Kuenenbacteria bacterium HGW-Kuenenbacteria-1]